MYPNLSTEQNNLHRYIFEQIKTAFATEPNIAATIHGQRKIFQGCYGRRTALFPSKKCAGAIPTESRLELAHAVCLEQNPTVINYRSQALKITLSQNNYCYPDFLIQTIDGSYEVHEVKPSVASLALDEYIRFDRLATLLSSIGIRFKLIDQTELPKENQLQQLLYWYQRGHRFDWSKFEIEQALNLLKTKQLENPIQVYHELESIGLKQELGDYLFFHQKLDTFPSQYSNQGKF
ncbi:hypothetical protein [Acinetobacter wuhouensis]|uniref:TnsA endonuclease N-terminal domain-containing protein n=1 Tax=Acinetobacter wuhouensis TaxID=1879050 RepID=A0A4Q7AJD2_9GAMM|nr:hypothetical protein [Acinetobacter wuhouensis]RZG43274.1 hypothetical protein EXU28_17705 [Acinetobacter wuhouensis]